ncbi:galactose-specific lectin nattectin-like isoform X1, partial [Clarias magur]
LKCKRNWTQFGARCFRMIPTSATWNASEQNCITIGAHLASVHSGDEYAYLEALVLSVTKSNAITWIGGNNLVQGAVWVWTDGSEYNYTKWASGEPDNFENTEHCVQMNYGGGWNDMVCTVLSPSICAKPAIPARIKSVLRFKIISEKEMLASDIKNLLQQ